MDGENFACLFSLVCLDTLQHMDQHNETILHCQSIDRHYPSQIILPFNKVTIPSSIFAFNTMLDPLGYLSIKYSNFYFGLPAVLFLILKTDSSYPPSLTRGQVYSTAKHLLSTLPLNTCLNSTKLLNQKSP